MSDDEIEELRTMLTGAYNQIGNLKDRVEELEAANDELEAEVQMLRQEIADEKTGEMIHEY